MAFETLKDFMPWERSNPAPETRSGQTPGISFWRGSRRLGCDAGESRLSNKPHFIRDYDTNHAALSAEHPDAKELAAGKLIVSVDVDQFRFKEISRSIF